LLKSCISSEVSHKHAEQAFQEYIDTIEELVIPNEIQQETYLPTSKSTTTNYG